MQLKLQYSSHPCTNPIVAPSLWAITGLSPSVNTGNSKLWELGTVQRPVRRDSNWRLWVLSEFRWCWASTTNYKRTRTASNLIGSHLFGQLAELLRIYLFYQICVNFEFKKLLVIYHVRFRICLSYCWIGCVLCNMKQNVSNNYPQFLNTWINLRYI
jgi:hypothetical protein